jgi:hypothetical protein
VVIRHSGSGSGRRHPERSACLDRPRADDQIVEHERAVVLLVGQEIAASMENRTIDYDEHGPDPGLVVS